MNLPQTIVNSISDLPRQCNLDKVILFGSRTRDTHRERSDIGLAIKGGDKYHLKFIQEKRIIISNDTPVSFSF